MDLVQPIVSHALVLFIPIQKAWCFSSIPYHSKDATILFFETQPHDSRFFGGLAQDSQRSTLLCLLNAQIKGVPHHAWLLKDAASLENIERKPTINCKHTLESAPRFPQKVPRKCSYRGWRCSSCSEHMFAVGQTLVTFPTSPKCRYPWWRNINSSKFKVLKWWKTFYVDNCMAGLVGWLSGPKVPAAKSDLSSVPHGGATRW